MKRTLFKNGSSVVVAIPREAQEALGLHEGDHVSVSVDVEHRQIVIRPAEPDVSGVTPEFAQVVREFIEEYRPVLEALAKR
ncbi:AbrB/MazE/SpoVT family DNA-binding domain-containing protein [Limnochorda pilosa]|uniref:AbrB family transcriptional regulator n=1 Tax=Limnochorda pilosa TaxID=1555112 RepID=A0A0K2SH97_LIMPI|nr:AbrB/MazE/SpoVT family DNA-binding domain-containing protein [Limnochorda pilosa]BAS26493.1 AbrB family transcriptional regulator [Limnochorda pilosa]